jgi:sporulation protein YqfC
MQHIELPCEPIPGVPLVEIIGNTRVLIEGHKGVVGYNENEIRIQTRMGCVRVLGNGMTLAQITKHRLVITGTISGINLT